MQDNKQASSVKVKAKKDRTYRKFHIDFDQAVSNNLLSLETAKKFLEQ